MEKRKKYFARRDLTILFVYLFLVAGIVCFSVFFNTNFVFPILLAVDCFIFILYTSIVFNSYYVLEEDYILVVHGIFKRRLFYRNIEEVKEKNAFTFPCISIKNLKLKNGAKFINYEYICPKEVELFKEELEKEIEFASNLTNYMEIDDE